MQRTDTESKRLVLTLAAVAAIAFAVRIIAALLLDGFHHPDTDESAVIARNMLAGRGFTYTYFGIVYQSYQAPLPAWLGAVSYWLTGSLVFVMTVQILAGTALAVVTAALAHRLFAGWIAPLAAGMLVAVHPGLVVYNAWKFHALSFDALFFALALLQSFRLAERPSARRGMQLGVIVGIGLLSRPTILVFLPLTAVWLLLTTPAAARRAAVGSMVVAALCMVAVVTPWTIRNYLVHDQFVLILTTDSELLWRGSNPYASGSAYVADNRTVISMLPANELRDLEQQPDELAQAQWFRTRAIAFIQNDPAAFTRLVLRKFVIFWSYSSTTGQLYPRAWFHAYMAYYVLVMLLVVVGARRILQSRDRRVPLLLLLGAFVIGLSVLQSLYYVDGRHRWAVEPMLLALTGGGVAALLGWRREF